jgi:hypothetical protein
MVQDFEAARKKALGVGAKKFFLDVRTSKSHILSSLIHHAR